MTTPVITNYNNTTQRTLSSTLGKQDFLNLLIMQMRHQDPLDPMKGTEFAAQLAQFSSLEQLTNLNESMNNSIDANAYLTQSINNALSTTFIGKDVRAAADTFRYNGEGDVEIGYELGMNAEKVEVKIYDESGKLIKTINGDTSKGENTLRWDGTNDAGEMVPVGNYKFEVKAEDVQGNPIENIEYIYGTVTGVRFKEEGTVFVIDGIEVALSSIVEIKEG